jgi:hypothetical protein
MLIAGNAGVPPATLRKQRGIVFDLSTTTH